MPQNIRDTEPHEIARTDEDTKSLQSWVGRTFERDYLISFQRLREFRSILDLDPDDWALSDPLPPAFHWCVTTDTARLNEIGHDGHRKRGGFLPPIHLPRRMWAGGRLQFHEPLLIGDSIRHRSTVKNLTHKAGKSGLLCFVTVEHIISGPRGLAITEEQDIAYRDVPSPGAGGSGTDSDPAPQIDGETVRTIQPSAVLLFRYSALTFNSHRIHYDRDYAMKKEGYPGLVVHGPLQATLLLQLARQMRPDSPIRSFSFRSVRPLFDLVPFNLCGHLQGPTTLALRTIGNNREETMQATASW
jgi:3-methylfumaryl-CoA hydratase